MSLRIESYNLRSRGAKSLARATGILLATDAQVARHGTFNTIINWGCSERRFPNATYINNPEAVAVASDKLRSARAFAEAGVRQPAFTTDQSEAQRWYDDGRTVVARRLLRASQARGLRLYRPTSVHRPTNSRARLGNESLDEAPLYTQYVKKSEEYRIHVLSGVTIDTQHKRRRGGVDNDSINYQIRNVNNGWVYCRDEISCPDSLGPLAIAAVAAVGLDFGAVDIGWNRHEAQGYVYEVNTAPGLEGATIDSYRRAFIELLPVLQGGAYQRRRRAG